MSETSVNSTDWFSRLVGAVDQVGRTYLEIERAKDADPYRAGQYEYYELLDGRPPEVNDQTSLPPSQQGTRRTPWWQRPAIWGIPVGVLLLAAGGAAYVYGRR